MAMKLIACDWPLERFWLHYVKEIYYCGHFKKRASCRFPATRHRVVVPEQEFRRRSPRQSIAFFVHPDDQVMIEVTYLYISGIVTIPKQSECNVNSYNKDTVAFCKCKNAMS